MKIYQLVQQIWDYWKDAYASGFKTITLYFADREKAEKVIEEYNKNPYWYGIDGIEYPTAEEFAEKYWRKARFAINEIELL